MTIIEAVRAYLLTSPQLDGDRLNVDFLPAEANTYSVDVTTCTPIVKRWIDGSSRRQFLFTLSTRAYYGAEIRQQIDNLAIFEEFSDWIDAQNRAKNFPDLGEGRTPQKIEVTTSGYAFTPQTDSARYQIQCKLTYIQKGER